uniref:U2A'/phosphoprotein 32 family A C-terminal domain-containing protein n=1 Tax=Spongospora subterranea TaxID=70186 RepID=A0A0H5R681_9EUKA|eukprot:CRZ09660.1 hypothetical protein [Spongospora subterranea]
MRLTADVIQQAPAFINPVLERELNLRGLKVPAIENLGSAEDQFDAIDLSDNDLIKLENFPVMKRLKSLLLNNNRIRRIARSLGRPLPNLETLIMTNNQMGRLEDLDALADLPGIERLSLCKNPVTVLDNYRLYVIFLLPKLRHLDFQKVSMSERQKAAALFKDKPKSLPTDDADDDAYRQQITPEQKKMIMAAILNAQSLDEISRLEALLKSGRVRDSDLSKIAALSEPSSTAMVTD